MRINRGRTRARHSRLKLTDVLQQRQRRAFPLPLHAPPDVYKQARRALRKADAVLLVGLDVLGVFMRHGKRTVLCSKGGVGVPGRGEISYLMLTAMIWRMERRTVVAAMVGANCSMDETLDAIWAEVTTQSSALLPVLRLMALRAMKRLEKHYEGGWEGKARYCTFMSFRRQR